MSSPPVSELEGISKFNLVRTGLGALPAPTSRGEDVLAILVDELLCSVFLRNLRVGLVGLLEPGAGGGVSLKAYRFNCGSGGVPPGEEGED